MPLKMYKLLKIIITRIFRIKHPDELKTNYKYFNIEANRAVLEKMLS
jgi:hypothetical protein